MQFDRAIMSTLMIICQLHNYGRSEPLLRQFGGDELNGELVDEIASEAIWHTFSDFRPYFNEWNSICNCVFFDPVLDRFFEVCRAYEARLGIEAVNNYHRSDIDREFESAVCFNDYYYSAEICTDLNKHGRCRLVLKFEEGFTHYYEVPGALLEILSALQEHTNSMYLEMANVQSKTHQLPTQQFHDREAA